MTDQSDTARQGKWVPSQKSFGNAITGLRVDSVADAAGADTTARLYRPLRRLAWRAGRAEYRAWAVGHRLAASLESGRKIATWAGPAGSMLMVGAVYLLSCMAAGAALEFGGSRATLQVWSDTLGGDVSTWIISVALGLVLVLLGHFIGELVYAATKQGGAARLACIAAAATCLAGGAVAIYQIGEDRPKNLEAQSALAEAGLAQAAADELRLEARQADRRGDAPGVLSKPTRRGNALRAKADKRAAKARALTRQAFRGRRLGFFTAVQWAALVLASVGGMLWASAAMERMASRFSRLRGKAKVRRERLFLKFLAIAALNERTTILAGAPGAGGVDSTFLDWAKVHFEHVFGPEPSWPELPGAHGEGGDELDDRRRRREDDDERRAA